MDRARSLPPGGGMDQEVVNPFWSQRLQQEALLRQRRPEDLPIPPDDDLELEAVQDSAVWALGKGRGVSAVGGHMFVTPPSHRGSEGRGRDGLRKTEGMMPGGGIHCALRG